MNDNDFKERVLDTLKEIKKELHELGELQTAFHGRLIKVEVQNSALVDSYKNMRTFMWRIVGGVVASIIIALVIGKLT